MSGVLLPSIMTEQRIVRFVGVTVACALLAAITVYAYVPLVTPDQIRSSVFFASVGLLALALAYQMPVGVSGNISFIPFLSALALGPGPVLVLSVALAIVISEAMHRRKQIKAVFNVAQYTLAISVASVTYLALGGGRIDPQNGAWYILPFVASYATWLVINTAAVSGVIATAAGKSMLPTWRQVAGGALLYDLLAIPVVYGFAYVYARWGAGVAAGVAVPLFGLRQLYKTNYQLETINQELLQLIVSTVEARDPYTSGHSERVSRYAAAICKILGTPSRESQQIIKAALLHDVGKIHEEFHPILRKPGKLSAEEYAVMQTHSAKGAVLVATVSQFRHLAPSIRAHHEAWDGSGYPDRLTGKDIPLAARVIALADTIDAMSTDRPYREALPPESIRRELIGQSGRQFDPTLIARTTARDAWEILAAAIVRASTEFPVLKSPVPPPRDEDRTQSTVFAARHSVPG